MKYFSPPLFVFFFGMIAFPTYAADWNLLTHGQTQSWRSLMSSDSQLVVMGNQGVVYVSTDNGITWEPEKTNTTTWLFDGTKMPNGDLMLVGENGTGILSSDNGKTWSQINLGVSGSIYAISAKNNSGYIVGAGGIFITRNGATNTWNTASLNTTDDLFAVQDMGDGTGWVVGANGGIYRLNLSGSSYERKALTIRETFRSVKFTDAKNGWVVGTSGTILNTTDGGFTWNPILITGVDTQTLYSIDINGKNIVIAGDKVLISSNDNGTTWNVKSFANTFNTFYDALAQANGTLFAVGSDYDVSSLIYKASLDSVIAPPVSTPTTQTPSNVPQSSLIKLACQAHAGVNDPCKAVYYYATDGKRHAFTNDKVYFSWFTDFSTVKEVSAEFLSSLTLGKNVTYRPGVKMVKFQTSPQVYAVAKGGVLRPILNESIAAHLYGSDWNKKIDDISDVFYKNYSFGEPIVTNTDFDPAQARILVGSISENF